MATAQAPLRNGASVDHIISIFADPEQAAGCKDSATSEQPCSSNSRQQHLGLPHGARKETTSAAAAIAAANETAAKYSVRSQRAPSADSQQQQGNTVLAYQVTPINLLTGAALAQPQVLSGSGAIALQTLLMKLNAQRLVEQLQQQQQQVTAQQSEAVQPQRHAAVKQEEGAPAQQQQQQQQPADPSAALARALAAAGQAAATADLQETLPHLPRDAAVAKDVVAPQQLLQQGPTAMVEQLQQFMQLQQRLETNQQGCGRAPGQALKEAAARSMNELDRMGSGACSSSCSDPLHEQPEKQRSSAMKLPQGLLGPGQHNWASAGGAAAAAAPAKIRR
jgi:hypothetical protein